VSSTLAANYDRAVLHPTGFELAAGQMFGEEASPNREPPTWSAATPLQAFEAAVLPALRRPPCLVSFSGGRDSSAVLAVAAAAARREGLDPPLPVTLRFPGAPRTDESEWQQQVIRHLGLREWEVHEIDDEMDLIGARAEPVLRRHGVLFPFNAYVHDALFEAARGGSFMTGWFGDHLFVTWRWRRPADVVARRTAPVPRDALRLGLWLCSPTSLRRRRERRRIWHLGGRPIPSWLRPAVCARAIELTAAKRVAQPRRWDRFVTWRAAERSVRACEWSLRLLAEDADTLLVHPFADPGFLAAVASDGGRLGIGDRTAAMRRIFSGALPDGVLARPRKALFDEAFFGPASREFARGWDGSGVDSELVDPEALRREWLDPEPRPQTAMLLQSAWLSGSGAAR
jgi:asparagine synthase (glutamine-hydrolysing)